MEPANPGPRTDFRENNCLRAVQCSDVGVVREASGSGRYSSGKTTAWASVYGPATSRYARHERHDRGSLEVDLVFMGEQAASREKLEKEGKMFLSTTLEQAIQMIEFPRMLIVIKVYVVRNDGSSFAAALNACVLGLLDACLPMYYLPVAISCCRDKHGSLLLDPTLSEEAGAQSGMLSVFSAAGEASQLVSSQCVGNFSEQQLFEAFALLRASVQLIITEFKAVAGNKASSLHDNKSALH